MTTAKRKTCPRLPSLTCPHCGSRAIVRSNSVVTPIVRELRMVCTNDEECGCIFVGHLTATHIVRQSAIPNPSVTLPVKKWGVPANDTAPKPANDEQPPAAKGAAT
jgi:DNA-directed RNA polymerase subunit RPC12/RpoP